MAIKVVEHNFFDRKEKEIYVVEFCHVDREFFHKAEWPCSDAFEERLYSMPLDAVSKTVYRIMPRIAGLNAD
jgi:hypothetical protein